MFINESADRQRSPKSGYPCFENDSLTLRSIVYYVLLVFVRDMIPHYVSSERDVREPFHSLHGGFPQGGQVQWRLPHTLCLKREIVDVKKETLKEVLSLKANTAH